MIEEAEWMIQEWALTVISMCEYFDLTESSLYLTLSKTESFVTAVYSILALTLPEPNKGMMENNIITLTATKHHVNLNITKSKTLAAMNMILGNIIESKRKILAQEMKGEVSCAYGIAIPPTAFTSMLELLAPSFIANLVALGQIEDFEQVRAAESVAELYQELVTVLEKMAHEQRFFSIFAAQYQNLIVHVCFVVLCPGAEELEELENSPSEYVAMIGDMCEAQESQTLMSKTAELLDHMVRNIDGACTFATYFAIQAIDSTLTNTSMSNEAYTYLKDWVATSRFLMMDNTEMRMVTSFYVLCVINFSITSVRQDLEKMLEGMFKLHGDVLFSLPSRLIQQSLGSFFYFYSGGLWEDDKIVFGRYLEYLATMASTPTFDKVAIEQACVTLNLLASEEVMLAKIEEYIPQILQIMVNGIPNHTKNSFFESLSEFASAYVYLLDD